MKFIKDPDSVLDYSVNWSAWLPAGDTIIASAFTVMSAATDAVVVEDSSFTATTTTVWLSGGANKASYTVTNHITTSQGRQDDRSLVIQMKEL